LEWVVRVCVFHRSYEKRSSHTAAEQTNWEGAGEGQARHAFLQEKYADLLGAHEQGAVPEVTEHVVQLGESFDLQGQYGEGKTLKVEGQYPHVSWKVRVRVNLKNSTTIRKQICL